ncbi:c-type cytochrome biogenesis protein CcmI [Rhodopila globiformis]|uniref:C-type cytochrome biogenesis protein CcmI n=1 Tax=Rhodopila globiformis TaxID=1071 RepID=A0A2S6MW81_RHOGL|nr:c-type cytochrome biogenesis protein CcmI [Rhodopila globiformis]PPQ26609.1 c-type cytochrome biogenesis protein CcmI [Rhodopila globiformis]
MILPFLLALLAFVALLPLLVPLLRGARPVPARANFDQAVYRDQLQELDRDIARGLLTETDAETARLEIQRRLLAAEQTPAPPARLARSPLLAVAVFLVVGLGSVGLYLWLGSPEVPDVPYASRPASEVAGGDEAGMQKAVAELAAKLKQNPSDPQGWLLYGRSLGMLNQWDKAEDAYRHAIDLGANSPEVLADHAEMMVMAASGTVTPAAEAAFNQILKVDPGNGMARFYLALARAQAGEPRKAIDGWQALLAEMPSDSPARQTVAQQIAQAAKAAGIPMPELAKGTAEPTPDQVAPNQPAPGPGAKAMADAARMSPEQREAMIRGMVGKLAAQQEADPTNLEGWLRLGKAYAVLHEPDKAADAYDKAAALKPDDDAIPLQAARALLAELRPPARIPPRVVGWLKQVEAHDPKQPVALWYLGLAAAQDSRPDDARRYWQALHAQLPADGEDAKMVQTALDALPAH